jgi:hypothetical protein
MLKEKAVAKQLVTFHWSRARRGAHIWRMNGQHSSNMLCDLNGEFPDGLFVHLDDYEVDEMSGLALLFRQFDDRKSGRTVGDVAGAYQGLVPELHGVAKDTAKLGIEGVAWYSREVEGIGMPPGDAVYDLLQRPVYHGFLCWLGGLFDVKTPEMRRLPVVAAIYGTWIKSESAAKEFWHQVARGGIEFEEEAPSTVLDAWLKRVKELSTADRAKAGLLGLKPADFFNGCIWAWNAYRAEKPIKEVRHDTRKGLTLIAD